MKPRSTFALAGLTALAALTLATAIFANASRIPSAPTPAQITQISYTFNPRGGAPFTFQGVLADTSGAPAASPVSLTFEYIAETGTGEVVLSTHTVIDLELDDGRFAVDIPLPNADDVLDNGTQFVRVTDADTSDVIADRIPVHRTPRALVADLAQKAREANFADDAENAFRADYADEAGNANFAFNAAQANTAQQADAMSDDLTVDLPEAANFRNSAGLAPIRARRSNGVVYLSGYLQQTGSISEGLTLTQLPVGMRPEHEEVFWAYVQVPDSSGRREVRVFPDGTVVLFTNREPGAVSLSGIVFQAAP